MSIRTGKNFLVRSLPLYVIETRFPNDDLDVESMVKLNMKPAPILWSYEGQYYLVPMEHVADVMDAVRRHHEASKTPLTRPTISMADAVALNYDVGWTLSRRPSNKKLQGRKRDGDDSGK